MFLRNVSDNLKVFWKQSIKVCDSYAQQLNDAYKAAVLEMLLVGSSCFFSSINKILCLVKTKTIAIDSHGNHESSKRLSTKTRVYIVPNPFIVQ